MAYSNDEHLSVLPSSLPEGRRVLRMQQRGAQRRPKARVLPEEVVCPTSVFTGGVMSNWYRCTCTVAALGLTLAFAVTVFADDPGFPAPTGDPAFVPAGAKLERLFDGGCMLTEGVAAGHDGMIYFSDITFTKFCKDPSGKYLQAGNIWQYNPQTGQTTIFRSPSGMANGIKFDREGNMIAALGADYGGRMLVKTEMQTGKSYILTGLFNGRPYNALNDISIDEKGRIYFSDPRYLGHEPIEQDGFAVYRLDPDGSVHRVVTDCGKCNGVLVSPDQKTLYVIGNDNGWFDLSACRRVRRPCKARISCRPTICLRRARPAAAPC